MDYSKIIELVESETDYQIRCPNSDQYRFELSKANENGSLNDAETLIPLIVRLSVIQSSEILVRVLSEMEKTRYV
jgi:hypothetical protein